MIRFVTGNLFESRAEALVNTVNCVGVMGKGIAHQFARAWPDMLKDYERRCKAGEIRVGEVTLFRTRGKVIINFPTKQHWKAKSRIVDIESGLRSLRRVLVQEGLTSVALPPLGCGNGGLDWTEVRPLIERELRELGEVDVEVYEPVGTFESRVTQEPKVSLSHYVLIALRVGLPGGGKLALQKSAYFFNVFANEQYFEFTRHKFGPYSPSIDPMSTRIADAVAFAGVKPSEFLERGMRQQLSGRDVERFRHWQTAIEAATALCERYPGKVEALATAHAVLAAAGPLPTSSVIEQFLAWSPEKAQRYSKEQVVEALQLLEHEGLTTRTLTGEWEAVPRPVPRSPNAPVPAEPPDQLPIPVTIPAALRSRLDDARLSTGESREAFIARLVAEHFAPPSDEQ